MRRAQSRRGGRRRPLEGQRPLFAPSGEHVYVSVDVETTGLDPLSDRIVQIGLVTADRQLNITWEGAVLVDPERSIPAVTTQIHGISDEDVRGCRTFIDVAQWVTEIVDGKSVIGHNVGFDLGFLQEEFRRVDRALPPICEEIDTLSLARRLVAEQGSYSLGALAQRFELSLQRSHDACFDAVVALELYKVLQKLI